MAVARRPEDKNERLVNRGTMWSHLRRRASRISGKADVTIIVHSIDDVNEQLERGRCFLSDVKVEARYSMEFSIARENLEILATHVRELCTRVEQACRERIASIAPPQSEPG